MNPTLTIGFNRVGEHVVAALGCPLWWVKWKLDKWSADGAGRNVQVAHHADASAPRVRCKNLARCSDFMCKLGEASNALRAHDFWLKYIEASALQ